MKKRLLQVISTIGLLLTFVPSILVYARVIEMEMHFTLMIAGMVLWFSTAPFWMKSPELEEEEED
jgi:hypothetical protein